MLSLLLLLRLQWLLIIACCSFRERVAVPESPPESRASLQISRLLKGDSNATIRVTDVGVGMCQASAIPTANIEHQQTSVARYPSISKVCWTSIDGAQRRYNFAVGAFCGRSATLDDTQR